MRSQRRVVMVIALIGAVFSSVCGTGPGTQTVPSTLPALLDPFPATVPGLPDSAMASHIYSDSNRVVVSDYFSGIYPRDIVWVVFVPESTVSERQAAVAAIGGRVVGGQAVTQHGFYYVQIVGDSTDTPLWRAISELESLPQVERAIIDTSLMIRGHTRPGPDGGDTLSDPPPQ